MGSVALTLAFVVALASAVPKRRASRIDPLCVINSE